MKFQKYVTVQGVQKNVIHDLPSIRSAVIGLRRFWTLFENSEYFCRIAYCHCFPTIPHTVCTFCDKISQQNAAFFENKTYGSLCAVSEAAQASLLSTLVKNGATLFEN